MTLKDVALKAGCSVATVSKALKNSSEISEDAKQRILSVAKELGYLKKATTHKAVLGGFKTAIFNDVKGDSAHIYKELLPIAKKSGLMLIYVSVSQADAAELMSQIGAFGLILSSGSKEKTSEKQFVLSNGTDGVKEFFSRISEYMPQRPSRAAANKSDFTVKRQTQKNKIEKSKQVEQPKPQEIKKEEIWLL